MKKALNKDIIRTIWKEKKRFFSIMMITMLGVTMMTGLSAGCQDLRYSADRFFDSQGLFDVSVLSTLGLTDDDVEVFQSLDIIEKAEGTFSEIVHTKKGDVNKTAEVKIIKTGGLNLPYIIEGNLPKKADEIAVTQNYMVDTGKQIGDMVTIEEIMDSDSEEGEDSKEREKSDREDSNDNHQNENQNTKEDIKNDAEDDNEKKSSNDSSQNENQNAEEDIKNDAEDDKEEDIEDIEIELEEEEEKPNFTNTTFQISGVVIDAMDINNAEGSAGFRATPNADYTFFITPDSIESDVYTAIYLSLSGTKELLCYSEEYEEKAGAVISMIEEEIMQQREQARYDEITGEAYDKISDAEEEMNEKFAEAEEKFGEAEEELAKAEEELAKAEEELAEGKKDIRDGWQEIWDGKEEFAQKQQEAAQEFVDAIVEIEDGYEKLKEGEEELREGEKELAEGAKQLNEGKQELIKQEESVREKIKQGEQELNSKIQENTKAQKQIAENLAKVELLFGEEWSKEGGIESAYDAYVKAAKAALLPVMQQQMSGGQTGTQQQQQAMQQILKNDTAVQAAQAELFGTLSTAAGNIVSTAEAYTTELQNTIADLETKITQVEMQAEGLEGEIADLESQTEALRIPIEELKQEAEALNTAVARLQTQKEETAAQLTSLENEIRELESQENALEEEKVQLENEIAQLEEEIAQLEDEAVQQNGESVQIENETITIERENINEESNLRSLEEKQRQLEEKKARLEEVKQQLTDTQNSIAAKQEELTAKQTELADRETELEEKQTELEGKETELEAKETELEEKQTELTAKQEAYQTAQGRLQGMKEGKETAETNLQLLQQQKAAVEGMQAQGFESIFTLAAGAAQSDAASVVLAAAVKELETQKQYAESQLADAWKQLEEGEQELAQGRAKLAEGWKEIEDNRKKLDDGVIELKENEQKAQQEFADAWEDIVDGEQELLEGEQELLEGEQELLDGKKELLEGEQELAENRVEFEEKKADATDKIAEAREKIADIDMTQWYVQDRTSLSGYANVESDAGAIESLASVFVIVFFIVAILISLTTVTRMVEEGRGLIGTYKALGFTDHEIRKKYVIYALGASCIGGILGDIGGFVILPEILFIFFDVMYMLPAYFLQFNAVSGIVSVILFVIGIAGAAAIACYAELKHLPAHLMRPKAPKMGSRVFLEYITPLWRSFSFLNKVTARNLFRYKKRLIMTVFGIMGCTALLLFGFAIKDSVSELMPMQYENVYKYDLLAAVGADDNKKLTAYMEDSKEVTEYINIQVESVKIKNSENNAEKVQMFIFPDEVSITQYLTLSNREYEPVNLNEEGIYLTENAVKILGLEKGETIAIQKMNLDQEETILADVVKNYLGNNAYMSQTTYEKVFGEYEPNGVLANLSDQCTDQIAFVDTLAEEDWIMSAVSTEDLKEGFSAAFTLINIVVYVVLILAAGLAFVVLFTLASVNISERIRELATIKVLGFFDKEVHLYVNKETLILTGIGILLGLPVGAALSTTLTTLLNMPSIYFAVTIYNRSYFFSAGLAFIFAFLVQFMTDRTLNEIDPVEALKSVE